MTIFARRGAPLAGGGPTIETIGWTADATDFSTQVDQDWDLFEGEYVGILVTMPSSGGPWVANAIEVVLAETSSANRHNLSCGITDSSGNLLTNGETECRTDIGTQTSPLVWYRFDFTTKPSLSASTSYIIFVASNSAQPGSVEVRGGLTNGDCTSPPTGVTCGRRLEANPTNTPCSSLDSSTTWTSEAGTTMAIYMEYQ